MAALNYIDADHGLDAPGWEVKAVVQKRVADDFTVADARNSDTTGEGIFYFDEATGVSHHYSPLEYVVLFDNASKVTVVPIHDVEMTVRFNDVESMNCAGVAHGS